MKLLSGRCSQEVGLQYSLAHNVIAAVLIQSNSPYEDHSTIRLCYNLFSKLPERSVPAAPGEGRP